MSKFTCCKQYKQSPVLHVVHTLVKKKVNKTYPYISKRKEKKEA